MTISSELLGVVDQRVLAYIQQPFLMGTLATRATSGAAGSVVFDGDNSAVPVKVLATVEVQPPDRVLLVRVLGSGARTADISDVRKPSPGEWVVIGGFTRRQGVPGSFVMSQGQFATPTTTTSAAFSNMPDVPPLDFVKRYDDTRLRLISNIGMTANVVANPAHGLQINGVDYELNQHTFSQAGHEVVAGFNIVTGLAAGAYTAQGRYRAKTVAATGFNAGDSWNISVEEIAP